MKANEYLNPIQSNPINLLDSILKLKFFSTQPN